MPCNLTMELPFSIIIFFCHQQDVLKILVIVFVGSIIYIQPAVVMSSIIEKLSLFPEYRIWRIRSKEEIKTVAGGVVSLLIIGALLALLVVKMIEVFDRTTVLVSENKMVSGTGRLTNLTTNSNQL